MAVAAEAWGGGVSLVSSGRWYYHTQARGEAGGTEQAV